MRIWPKSEYKWAGWPPGLVYFIPTKFGDYPSSDSVVKSDYVFQYIYTCTSAPPPPTFHLNK